MAVRAKFKVDRFEATLFQRWAQDGKTTELVEMRTVVLSPVYSNDPESENRKFWDASPSGEVRLGTVNPGAWSQFELGKEYYVDFTPADESGQTPSA